MDVNAGNLSFLPLLTLVISSFFFSRTFGSQDLDEILYRHKYSSGFNNINSVCPVASQYNYRDLLDSRRGETIWTVN